MKSYHAAYVLLLSYHIQLSVETSTLPHPLSIRAGSWKPHGPSSLRFRGGVATKRPSEDLQATQEDTGGSGLDIATIAAMYLNFGDDLEKQVIPMAQETCGSVWQSTASLFQDEAEASKRRANQKKQAARQKKQNIKNKDQDLVSLVNRALKLTMGTCLLAQGSDEMADLRNSTARLISSEMVNFRPDVERFRVELGDEIYDLFLRLVPNIERISSKIHFGIGFGLGVIFSPILQSAYTIIWQPALDFYKRTKMSELLMAFMKTSREISDNESKADKQSSRQKMKKKSSARSKLRKKRSKNIADSGFLETIRNGFLVGSSLTLLIRKLLPEVQESCFKFSEEGTS